MEEAQQSSFPDVRKVVAERAGLSLDSAEADDLNNAVVRAMHRVGLQSVLRFLEELVGGCPLAFDALVEELTIRETYFFRDVSQLDWLRAHVLPRLLAEREPDRPMRVWSAGCSSGEEAYTLAIILQEVGRLDNARVVGTDISREALVRARRGVYRPWSMRGVAPALQQRFFEVQGEDLVIASHLRAAVSFSRLNLVDPDYPSIMQGLWEMDLILCRNVFIYFRPEAVRSVATRLHATLAEGGWLILGPSDPILPDDLPFETIQTPAGAFYRRRPAGGPTVVSEVQPGCASAAPPPRPSTVPPAAAVPPRATGLLDRNEEQAAAELRARVNQAPAREVQPLAALAVERHPLSAELHFLHALVLLDMGEDNDALDALQRVVYLDPTLAIAWFYIGTLQAAAGDERSARRAWRNAREWTARQPRDTALPLAPGETAGALSDAVRDRLARLDAGPTVQRAGARRRVSKDFQSGSSAP